MRCAIFCNVIDNFGDIGICWRLARQLATEYHLQTTLFVDDLSSFAVLAPTIQPHRSVQQLGQITVQHWHAELAFEQAFDLVIEGFGCRLEDQLIAHMNQQARAGQPPLWINLEYLSAEDWVMQCHGMVSIHPATGLKQTFWFPSVTENSGGLIREAGLIFKRDAFQKDIGQQATFWDSLDLPDVAQFARKISLFSYKNNVMADLLDALATDPVSTLLLVPHSKSIPDIEQWLGQSLQVGDRITQQNLTIAVLPFLSQERYDQLLWACDLNFIRGEDSCVRAQWAGRPFIWHIYPQDENAHLTKLQAWINQIESVAWPVPSWYLAMQVWNDAAPSSQKVWQLLLAELPVWHQQTTIWCNYLTNQPGLAARLMDWVDWQEQP